MPAVPAAIRMPDPPVAAARAPLRSAVTSHRCSGRLQKCLDDRHGFGPQRRAARVDQPPARRKQRPGRAQQLQLLGRKRCDVVRPAQQLDVRMPPDDARRRARHVEQDPVERSPVPPGWRARAASPATSVADSPKSVAGCPRRASAARRRHRPRRAPQVQAAARADGRSCRPAPRRHPARARRAAAPPVARRAARRHPAPRPRPAAKPGSSRDVHGVLEQQRLVVEHAVRNCDAAALRVARDTRRRWRARRFTRIQNGGRWLLAARIAVGVLAPVRRSASTSQRGCAVRIGEIAIDLARRAARARAGSAAGSR